MHTSAFQFSTGGAVENQYVVGEYLFMMNDMMSIVTNYEAATGKLVYQGRLGRASREGFSASPVALDGKVFFTNDGGQTFVRYKPIEPSCKTL